MAKKVLKSAIIKMCKEVGLTPIEDSWKSEKDNYNEVYLYELKTQQEVFIYGDKYFGEDESFVITHNNRKLKPKVDALKKMFENYGYKDCAVAIDYDQSLEKEVKKLLENQHYNETLLKIKELLESE